jgi:hypothetical protein
MSFRPIIFMIIVWACTVVHCQNKELVYDFTEIPQALMINPGARNDFEWYAGIPALSGISLQAGISGISANDLFANDGLDINDKVRDRAIYGLSTRDEQSTTFQLEILNGGFHGKKNEFYSFGMYVEGDVINYWPQDYAILAFEGNANQIGRRFDFGDLKVRGELVNVFHFGINKRLNNLLRVGIRAKLYSGILDVRSANNRGYFVTTEGNRNLLANTIDADLIMRTSGVNAFGEAHNSGTITNFFLKRAFFGGDLGAGFDLGLTYHLNKQTVFTASLLDIGFIYHANDVNTYDLKGSATVEGVEVILPDALSDPNRDFWQDLVDEVETLVPFRTSHKNYISLRPTRTYASLRYNFGEELPSFEDCDCGPNSGKGGAGRRAKYANAIGGQLYMVSRPRGPQMALTAFYHRNFGNLLAIKTTYTVDKFSATNFGLGLSLQLGPINAYLMADNLFAYGNLAASRYASFQLGLNIISWSRK